MEKYIDIIIAFFKMLNFYWTHGIKEIHEDCLFYYCLETGKFYKSTKSTIEEINIYNLNEEVKAIDDIILQKLNLKNKVILFNELDQQQTKKLKVILFTPESTKNFKILAVSSKDLVETSNNFILNKETILFKRNKSPFNFEFNFRIPLSFLIDEKNANDGIINTCITKSNILFKIRSEYTNVYLEHMRYGKYLKLFVIIYKKEYIENNINLFTEIRI